LVLVAAVAALMLAGPGAAQAKFFQEWGLAAFGNQSMDIDNGNLNEAGLLFHVAAPLVDNKDIRVDFRLEGLLGTFWDYGSGVEVGVIPGLRLYVGKVKVQPYLEAGIGPTYNSLDIQELGIGFNFLSYGGVGLRLPLGDKTSLEFGYRLRHISNAGLDDRNHGVTSSQLQIGFAIAF
jgi:hypothetical protein